MAPLTSEAIAKSLKGAGLSSEARIQLATEAWHDHRVFFPRKDDFLLEWLCNALCRPSKDEKDAAWRQIGYWQLLHALLEHYDQKPKGSKPPAIRVPLLQAVTQAVQSNMEQPSLEALTAGLACLLSPTFALSFRPAFDQTASALEAVLDKVLQDGEYQALAAVLLDRFDTQVTQAPNPKKVFTSFTGRFFASLLAVRRRVSAMADQITRVLVHGLFHPETVLEYTMVAQSTSNSRNTKQRTNFVSALFEELARMLHGNQTDDALAVLPVLLHEFILAFRKRRGTLSDDVTRTVEFGFFKELLNLIEAGDSTFHLQTLYLLLDELLQSDVYRARNDTISRTQLATLEEIADKTVAYIKDTSKYHQGVVFRIVRTLLQLDYALVESRISHLWPSMVNPSKDAEADCTAFVAAVLETYTASRQLDAFVDDILNALPSVAYEGSHILLEKPLFRRDLLQAFASAVHHHLPSIQGPAIFDRLCSELTSEQDAPPAKKRKQNGTSQPRPARLARFVAVFLTQFIGAFKPTPRQKPMMAATMATLWQAFLSPALQEDPEGGVLPALQIHFALANALPDVYWDGLDASKRVWLADTLLHIFRSSTTALDTLNARMVAVYSANALLQHAYLTFLETPDAELSVWVNPVIDFVATGARLDSQWDGMLAHLEDGPGVRLACWKLLVDDWFEIVSRVVDDARASQLASGLLGAPPADDPHTLSLNTLQKIVLSSAAFYEADRLRVETFKVALDRIAAHFKHQSGAVANVLAQANVPAKEFSQALSTHGDALTNQNCIATSEAAQTATDLIRPLLVFPPECLARDELRRLDALVFLLDLWAGPNIVCRSLLLRLYRHRPIFPLLGTHPACLAWFLDSVSEETAELKTVSRDVFKLMLGSVLGTSADNEQGSYVASTFEHCLTYLDGASPRGLDWIVDALDTINAFKERHAKLESIPVVEATLKKVAHHVLHELRDTPSETLSSQVLQLTSRLQRYARLFDAQEALDTPSLSQALIALASPLTRDLQRQVDPAQASAFVDALCTTLQSNDDVTERILAVVWYLYSATTSDAIASAFRTWLQGLTFAQFNHVLVSLAALCDQDKRIGTPEQEQVFLSLVSVVLSSYTEAHKGNALRNSLFYLVPKLSLLAGRTRSVQSLLQILHILVLVSKDKTLTILPVHVSLILSCILQVSHPTAAERLTLDADQAHSVFEAICHVLQSLLLNHRKEVVAGPLSTVIGILQSLLHCFRTAHVVVEQAPPKAIPILFAHAPLRCAPALARVLEHLGQKKFAGASETQHVVAKHAPFLLMEYFVIQQNASLCIMDPALKAALLPGLYSLMDVCGPGDRDLVMTGLENAGKLLYKNFHTEWAENHKYKGQ